MKKFWLSWSSGKDSAWALHILKQHRDCEVTGLITTINSAFDRVAMHGTRRELVEMQAEAAGIPLVKAPLPWPCSNLDYEAAMKTVCDRALAEGVSAIAFGDLYLADIRAYREQQLNGTGLEPLFPLWQSPTDKLAREMIDGGLRARLVCVDPRQLDPKFVGREFDFQLLSELPDGVDPCGENGEFHSFVTAGPMLDRAIAVKLGDVVERDGFAFADLMPDVKLDEASPYRASLDRGTEAG